MQAEKSFAILIRRKKQRASRRLRKGSGVDGTTGIDPIFNFPGFPFLKEPRTKNRVQNHTPDEISHYRPPPNRTVWRNYADISVPVSVVGRSGTTGPMP
ncbi:hypothetical protein K0M31_004349 [Melipona bicolor]|uniref:Uncharacterized protein n=1 Tax=Melipona bicolor TaxID=60889 RepID=A0AA40KNE4_9HYME|nr:hypothetical protein K0M31_004349 [Melipona bicolor]